MPTTTVLIPTALRKYADGRDTVELEGANVGQVLDQLTEQHPSLRIHLFDDSGNLRNFVNVFVNDSNIRNMQDRETPISDQDTISIVPAVAGGQQTEEAVDLTKDERERYSRHLIMPEVGVEGQKKLKAGKVLVVGAGGLGSPLALYLAAAGVGRIGLVDFDVVDFTNLQRQVVFGTENVGQSKLDAAKDRIQSLNPNVEVTSHTEPLTSQNALDVVSQYDVVVDGTDNFPTRYLVNDACVLTGKPNVYGSIFRFDGQASVFHYADGPCYRCLYPDPPPPGLVPSCAEGGVLGILPGIVGVIQATETIKILLGSGETLSGRLLLFDALRMTFRPMKIRRNPECPVCGDNPTVTELIDYKQFCGVADQPAQEETEQQSPWDITVHDYKRMRDDGADVDLLDVREPHEYEICNLGGRLIPVGQLSERMTDLDPNREVVVHCRSGGRSAKAVQLLRDAGFQNAHNLRGGVLAWADEVDPSMPKY